MSKATRRIAPIRVRISITSLIIAITTIGAEAIIVKNRVATNDAIRNRDAWNRRWKAPLNYTARSGAAWVYPACQGCRKLVLAAFGRDQDTFNTEFLELDLRRFGFLPGTEWPNLNAGFQRRGHTTQGQLGV